jgi:hypothetical protein
VFRGVADALSALMQAVERNCSCELHEGVINGKCPAHRALLEQHFLDGMLFGRYLAERLQAEEFTR